MDHKEILVSIGLESKEVAAYIASLELGEATVLEIAKKSGIKRPTAYVVLNILEQKGLVSKVIKGKKSFFVPGHPKKLVTEAELRLRELKQSVPQLETLYHKDDGNPRVSIYTTKEESDRASDDMFLVKGEVWYMGTLRLSQEAFPRTFRKLDLARLSPEFRIKELIDDSPASRAYAKIVQGPHRQVRFIPRTLLPFEVDISVFGNQTLITSVKKEHFTVGIKSDEINRSFRGIFEVMWQIAAEAK
jgi:HTH-type transcriptional regulator, sugar sensing transcriptional regulator